MYAALFKCMLMSRSIGCATNRATMVSESTAGAAFDRAQTAAYGAMAGSARALLSLPCATTLRCTAPLHCTTLLLHTATLLCTATTYPIKGAQATKAKASPGMGIGCKHPGDADGTRTLNPRASEFASRTA